MLAAPQSEAENAWWSRALAAGAFLLIMLGNWALHKAGKEPRPKADLEGNNALRRDLQLLKEAVEQISRDLLSEMSSVRGELNQLDQRVARQGGVLRGLEKRFNASNNEV